MNYGSFRYAFCAVLVTLLCSQWARAQACIADITGDRMVEGKDLAYVLSQWGMCDPLEECSANINSDGEVDAVDLAMVLAAWGPCPVVVPSWATVIEAYPDPMVVHDSRLRASIIATGYPWRVRDTATQIEMLLIPPGVFQMGCSPGDPGAKTIYELPVHQVTLTHPFYIGRYELTQAQWMSRMGSNPSAFAGTANRPVERVSWNDVQIFLGAIGMRLPTEAEWEYAYRAGTTTAFHNGSNDVNMLGHIAWFSVNSGWQSRPVGQKAANGFGLHDMAGNVREWVSDWFGMYLGIAQTDPAGPSSGQYRVTRGGSFGSIAGTCRASDRLFDSPYAFSANWGFRVTRDP